MGLKTFCRSFERLANTTSGGLGIVTVLFTPVNLRMKDWHEFTRAFVKEHVIWHIDAKVRMEQYFRVDH